MYLHWDEEHQEELNSHDEEKVKKAKRKENEEKRLKMKTRKKIAGWGLAGLLALIFIAVIGAQTLKSVEKTGNKQFNLQGQPVLGNPDANVTIVAFEDFKCPYCARFTTQVYPKIKSDISTKTR